MIAPGWIRALFPGRCRKCWAEFGRGATVLYDRAARCAFCLRCGEQHEHQPPSHASQQAPSHEAR